MPGLAAYAASQGSAVPSLPRTRRRLRIVNLLSVAAEGSEPRTTTASATWTRSSAKPRHVRVRSARPKAGHSRRRSSAAASHASASVEDT